MITIITIVLLLVIAWLVFGIINLFFLYIPWDKKLGNYLKQEDYLSSGIIAQILITIIFWPIPCYVVISEIMHDFKIPNPFKQKIKYSISKKNIG